MELPGKRISKVPNIKIFDANTHMDNHLVFGGGDLCHEQFSSRIFDPYAENLDHSSPMIRYFSSRSPISAAQLAGEPFSTPLMDVTAKYGPTIVRQYSSNSSGSSTFGSRGGSSISPLSAVANLGTPPLRSPPVYGTPVKVDDEVLVMDGILVESVFGGARSVRANSESSSGSAGGSSSSSGKNLYKTDICLSWEDSGSCRYGSKCQFAHGKEELRPTRFPISNKSKLSKSYTSRYGPKCHYGQQVIAAAITEIAPPPMNQTPSVNKLEDIKRESMLATVLEAITLKSQSTSPTKQEDINLSPTATVTSVDWSPEDDDINVVLPHSSNESTPGRENVDIHIRGVLYGSTAKRLPIFIELCP